MNGKCIGLLVGSVLFTLSATAQKMIPDPNFGSNGVVITPEQGRFSVIEDISRQSDGKIIVAGATYDHIDRTTCIARYLPDGTLDSSFGTNGKTHLTIGTYSSLQAIAIQADGKIVAAGNETITGPVTNTRPFLVRYNNDGSPDNGFGNGGIHYLGILNPYFGRSAIDIAVLSNGDILLAGNGSPTGLPLQMMLLCLKSDGSYQTNFGTSGVASYTVEAGKNATLYGMQVQADGKIVICGYSGTATLTAPPDTRMAVARIQSNGLPDSSFGTNGFVALQVSPGGTPAFDVASRLDVQSTGKILLVGGSSGKLAAARLMPDGSPDLSFDQDGIVYHSSINEAEGMTVTTGGRILITGTKLTTSPAYTTDIILNSLTTQGAIDFSFGTVGSMIIDQSDQDEANAIVVHSNGKILVAGHTEDPVSGRASFTLWQFVPDPANIDDGILSQTQIYPNPVTNTLHINLQQPLAPVTIHLLDITGKTVLTMRTMSATATIDMSKLPSGSYALQLITNNQMQTKKLVKQ